MSSLSFAPPGFNIGNLEIKYYALIITGAMIIGLIYVLLTCKRYNFTTDFVLELFIWLIPFAIIFARLAYVIFHASEFPLKSGQDFINIINIRSGGISILGGIPGGALGVFICCKIRKKSFGEVADLIAPGLVLAQALGRFGNFVNQELYGELITNPKLQWYPFAVQIQEEGNQWFQATCFYEMFLNLIGFGIIFFISRKYKKNYTVLLSYLTWYMVVRAIMESIRADAVAVGSVKIGVLGCSIAAVIFAVLTLLVCLNVIKTKSPAFLTAPTAQINDDNQEQEK